MNMAMHTVGRISEVLGISGATIRSWLRRGNITLSSDDIASPRSTLPAMLTTRTALRMAFFAVLSKTMEPNDAARVAEEVVQHGVLYSTKKFAIIGDEPPRLIGLVDREDRVEAAVGKLGFLHIIDMRSIEGPVRTKLATLSLQELEREAA